MDSVKKATIEKRVIAGLAVVLVLNLARGPLMNLLQRSQPSVQESPIGSVDVSKPIGQLMTDYWANVEHATRPDVVSPPQAPAPPARYQAQELRDPMVSLLPSYSTSGEPATFAPAGGGPDAAAAAARPPTLRVQGILWGGIKPNAVIDNKVYGIGDSIEGSRIVLIDRQGVTIDHFGTRVFYAIMPPSSEGAGGAHQWR